MTDQPPLSLATDDDLHQTLSYARRLDVRGNRARIGGELVAQIAAKRLVVALKQAGYVIMKKPPAPGAAALARGAKGE